MAKLTADKRNAMPDSEFAEPGKRKFPLDTPGRAANAKGRATQMVKKGKLSPAERNRIVAKANRILNGQGG